MTVQYTAETFLSLRDEYETLCKSPDTGIETSTRRETLEGEVLGCARYLASSEKHLEAMYWLSEQRLYGACTTGLDAQEIEQYLSYGAERDHLPSIRLLAKYYFGWDKIITPNQIDRKKAAELFERAFATGDHESRYDLALFLIEDHKDSEQLDRARSILKELMTDGYAPAHYTYYGRFCLFEEIETSDDESLRKAYQILTSGINSLQNPEFPYAEWYYDRLYYFAALCLYEGIGTEKDFAKAVEYMRRSAGAGHLNDAFFWLKNKGLEKLLDLSPGEDYTNSNQDKKPLIFSTGFKSSDLGSSSPEASTHESSETSIVLDKPLTFINFGDQKGKKLKETGGTSLNLDLKKEDIDAILLPFDNLVGLQDIKNQLRMLIYTVLAQGKRKAKGLEIVNYKPSLHMVFTGNPGTGKTTVARFIGEMLKKMGYLKSGHVVEVDRSKLVGEYIGQSEKITTEVLKRAQGGVLFIDEAYELDQGFYWDFGNIVTTMLVKVMEDKRDDLIIIMAGYPAEMQNFLDSNPGLRSRVALHLNFSDFTTQQMVSIFENYCKSSTVVLSELAREKIVMTIRNMPANKRDKFGNARGIRNLFEETLRLQAKRIIEEDIEDVDMLMLIQPQDIPGEPRPSGDSKAISYLSRKNEE